MRSTLTPESKRKIRKRALSEEKVLDTDWRRPKPSIARNRLAECATRLYIRGDEESKKRFCETPKVDDR